MSNSENNSSDNKPKFPLGTILLFSSLTSFIFSFIILILLFFFTNKIPIHKNYYTEDELKKISSALDNISDDKTKNEIIYNMIGIKDSKSYLDNSISRYNFILAVLSIFIALAGFIIPLVTLKSLDAYKDIIDNKSKNLEEKINKSKKIFEDLINFEIAKVIEKINQKTINNESKIFSLYYKLKAENSNKNDEKLYFYKKSYYLNKKDLDTNFNIGKLTFEKALFDESMLSYNRCIEINNEENIIDDIHLFLYFSKSCFYEYFNIYTTIEVSNKIPEEQPDDPILKIENFKNKAFRPNNTTNAYEFIIYSCGIKIIYLSTYVNESEKNKTLTKSCNEDFYNFKNIFNPDYYYYYQAEIKKLLQILENTPNDKLKFLYFNIKNELKNVI